MKRIDQMLTASCFALVVLAGAAARGESAGVYYVYADVVDVEPIVRHSTVERPHQVCEEYAGRYGRSFDYPEYEPGPAAGILGGIVGGLIGNQFGGGRGKKILTITGALAGASIADKAARNRYRHRQPRRARECWTVNDIETVNRLESYRVTYQYQGHEFVKHMDEHPGNQVRIRVSVAPEPIGS